MAIKANSIKCPECGAILPYDENHPQKFCSFCGARIVFTNENEFIIRHIDDAKIKRAETDLSVQLKKMEIIEKRRADAASAKRIKIIVSLIMGILCVLFLSFPKTNGMVIVGLSMPVCIMLIWTIGLVNREGDDIYIGDKIKVPRSISNFEEKTYPTIETCLSDAGFTNINCVPLNDLKVGLVHRPGTVESITINGIKIESGGRSFPSDSIIVISYHSFPK